MAEWWSIEVLHGEFSAFRWQEQHDSALIEAALTNGAVDGSWYADRWGVVFEICFENEERLRGSAACRPCVRPWTACQIPSAAARLPRPGRRSRCPEAARAEAGAGRERCLAA
jgi:hypothetical protein